MKDSDSTKVALLSNRLRPHKEAADLPGAPHSDAIDQDSAKERCSLAMQGTKDGLWDWNLETDEVYYSPHWKSMLGYMEDELDHSLDTWARLIHPDDKGPALAMVQDRLSGANDAFEFEMRMRHKDGHYVHILSRAALVLNASDGKPIRMVGTHLDISERTKANSHILENTEILEMIAIGRPAIDIYNAIALMYEGRHPGMRCSLLELHGNKLLHGGAPSLPKAYSDAIHGLEYGPKTGSCGTSTYTGRRVLVENIGTDPKWVDLKAVAMPFGMRCCWSEPIKSSAGKVLGAFGMYYDYPALPNEEESGDMRAAARLAGIVMERDQNQKRIRQLAYFDELTGLASRAHFFRHLDELIKTSAHHNRRFSLLYIDLHDFKSVNDSLGHEAGDRLLKDIGGRLESVGREVDFVARLSGDEFCVLAEDTNDDLGAAKVAQHCLDIIGQSKQLCGRQITPACSIGIAHYPDDGTTASTLLKAGDTALYAAKARGKNRFSFYKPDLTRKAEQLFQFEQALRKAIKNHELSLVYQPQVDAVTGKIVSVEALSRWDHSELGQVPPAKFISTAERIGVVRQLTESVLCAACKQALEWKQSGLPKLRMAVNVSPSQFLDNGIVNLVRQVLEETGMDPADLELEVTEGVVQTSPKNLVIFKKLKELGIHLAIDDFGTGYSSFASLKHLTVDTLKIDKYFVDDILTDNQVRLLIGSMIQMGHDLGHGIIAEGVESEEQLEILKELGCEAVQGNLLGEPVGPEDIATMLRAQTTSSRSGLQNP